MVACILDYNWPTYVVASLVSFFGGVAVLLPLRLLAGRVLTTGDRFGSSAVHRSRLDAARSFFARFQAAAESVLAGNSRLSKAIVFVLWIVDMAAIVVFLVEATASDPYARDECGKVRSEPIQQVWIALMCISLIRFIIKMCAAQDKLLSWIEVVSIVDHFTIVPTFVGIYYDKNWIGLRFLRMVHLLRATDMLQLFMSIKNRNALRFARAMTVVATAWTFGASMFYLLENNGDPWQDYSNQNPQHMYFWTSFYLVLVILSTIGFGDIFPVTLLGRVFLVIYVLMCLAMFGQLLPELAALFTNRSKYKKPHKPVYGRSHLVICGGITFETLTTVVKNFINQTASVAKVDMVVINRVKPSAKLQAFFRRNFNNVTFIEGTVLSISTLKLAKLERATAVLILANRWADDQDVEDSANIMRATAVKNFRSDARIIIQLLQHRNKEQMLHIPSWSWHKSDGDEVICISELKLSLMAQNCFAPGIVTLLTNLIAMNNFKNTTKFRWLDSYTQCARQQIVAELLPEAFVGSTFRHVAERCYTEFGLLLLAVGCRETHGQTKIRVNPAADSASVVESQNIGFFIARSSSDVRRMTQVRAQSNVNPAAAYDQLSVIIDCGAPNGRPQQQQSPSSNSQNSASNNNNNNTEEFQYLGDAMSWHERPSVCSENAGFIGRRRSSEDMNHNVAEIFDPTGMVYWCPSCPLDQAILDADLVREMDLKDHIILVLSASSGTDASRRVGLRNFLRPLRTSSVRAEDIQVVVFYVNLQFIEAEWPTIACFPKVFVYPRTESMHIDLKALNIHRCSVCVVMETSDLSVIDDRKVDTNAIRTTMNILSLYGIERKVRQIGELTNADEFRSQVSLRDEVQMLIELEHDTSVMYIDDDDEDDPSLPLYLTTPYACGRVLLASVLDSLVTTAFVSPDLMRLFRALITGGEATDFERVLADRLGVIRRGALTDVTSARRRSTLALFGLTQPPLNKMQHNNEYGKLVLACLKQLGLLCLGVYRLLADDQTSTSKSAPRRQKRYVITNPPSSFQLQLTDKVYVMKPFEESGDNSTETDSGDERHGNHGLLTLLQQMPVRSRNRSAAAFLPPSSSRQTSFRRTTVVYEGKETEDTESNV